MSEESIQSKGGQGRWRYPCVRDQQFVRRIINTADDPVRISGSTGSTYSIWITKSWIEEGKRWDFGKSALYFEVPAEGELERNRR